MREVNGDLIQRIYGSLDVMGDGGGFFFSLYEKKEDR